MFYPRGKEIRFNERKGSFVYVGYMWNLFSRSELNYYSSYLFPPPPPVPIDIIRGKWWQSRYWVEEIFEDRRTHTSDLCPRRVPTSMVLIAYPNMHNHRDIMTTLQETSDVRRIRNSLFSHIRWERTNDRQNNALLLNDGGVMVLFWSFKIYARRRHSYYESRFIVEKNSFRLYYSLRHMKYALSSFTIRINDKL